MYITVCVCEYVDMYWHTWDNAPVELAVDGVDALNGIVLLVPVPVVVVVVGDGLRHHIVRRLFLKTAFVVAHARRRWCSFRHTQTCEQWRRVLNVFSGRDEGGLLQVPVRSRAVTPRLDRRRRGKQKKKIENPADAPLHFARNSFTRCGRNGVGSRLTRKKE